MWVIPRAALLLFRLLLPLRFKLLLLQPNHAARIALHAVTNDFSSACSHHPFLAVEVEFYDCPLDEQP